MVVAPSEAAPCGMHYTHHGTGKGMRGTNDEGGSNATLRNVEVTAIGIVLCWRDPVSQTTNFLGK